MSTRGPADREPRCPRDGTRFRARADARRSRADSATAEPSSPHAALLSQDQVEFAERSGIPYPVISDEWLELERWLGLPTFGVEGMTLYKRLALVAEAGRIVKVFYPVFPPDRNAEEVLEWLKQWQAD